jgi:hypothetical protein
MAESRMKMIFTDLNARLCYKEIGYEKILMYGEL